MHISRKLPLHVVTTLLCAGLAAFSLGATCGGEDDGGDPPLQWYQTCGDPACGGFNPPPGAAFCTDQVTGDVCPADGDSCVIPDDSCNTSLLCTDSDPATMCPISQRAAKRDIDYVSPAERAQLAETLLSTRLARYHYRAQDAATPRHLGFIIEDQPNSPAVLPRGDRVDLYGYTSMAVAAIQEQAQELARLRAELAELRAELAAEQANNQALSTSPR